MVVEYANSVAIGPEFFGKSFNDYRDKFWAFAREIMQNSFDCGSKNIYINIIEREDGGTQVVVRNDGESMTREILTDKLLSLGSSGKNFEGAVGGFGKAKEILYFAHKRYGILSGEWAVEGSGAGYDIGQYPPVAGTTSNVIWAGDVADRLREAFRRFYRFCDRRGCKVTLDGEVLVPSIPRFRCQRGLEYEGTTWATLGVHDFEPGVLLVRIGGIPMFTENTDYRQTIVLELSGDSGERLTANRDSLKYPYSTRFRELVTQMTVDRRSALQVQKPVYTRYGGPRLRKRTEEVSVEEMAAADPILRAILQIPSAGGGQIAQVQGRNEHAASLLSFRFVNKNCVRRAIPKEFDPLGLEFSDYAHWLVLAWAGCLVELHTLFEIDHEFTVGFVFSEDNAAEFEKTDAYGRLYNLNPCVVGKRTSRRRFTKRDRGTIAAIAAHEFVHGGFNLSYHGEDFAGMLTDVTAKMLNHWRRFARYFT